MTRFRFSLRCPRCKKTSTTVSDKLDPLPVLNCGDCLMNATEIVELKVVRATPTEVA